MLSTEAVFPVRSLTPQHLKPGAATSLCGASIGMRQYTLPQSPFLATRNCNPATRQPGNPATGNAATRQPGNRQPGNPATGTRQPAPRNPASYKKLDQDTITIIHGHRAGDPARFWVISKRRVALKAKSEAAEATEFRITELVKKR
ncbi:hypothetical protein BV898_18925 [Hypsibius exemplaris]|uniref:Uncharacterized protein n=1 Tax=Hypsibius exemplaris TaxID=2072580 RepID=A0A9X6NHT7_HYPEX|nr:hypothetical protein BV898_18925 [Hypsibius exemplaris]